MIADEELAAARNEALQKIGRNLVNFQRMEAMLRFILGFAGLSGSAAGTADLLRARQRESRKASMGTLVDRTGRSFDMPAPGAPPGAKQPWISHSISFQESPEAARDWRREMRAVVRERNRLVHHMLSDFDPGSAESCRTLAGELDAQRERIRRTFDQLVAMVGLIRQAAAELEANQESILAALTSGTPPPRAP